MGAGSKVVTGAQYEALCRYAIAREYGVEPEQIHSGRLNGGSRSGERVRHQIDLYWKVEDGMCEFLVFANAKYRKTKVELPDVMTLLGVWQEIGAHKGMIITNTGFSRGALQLAEDRGIALLIVKPVVEIGELGRATVAEVVVELERRAAEKGTAVYEMGVVHKGWGESRQGDKETGRQGEGNGGGWFVVGGLESGNGVENKAMGGGSVANKMMGGVRRK